MGFHLVICAIACLIIRGNMIAAAFGTFIGNPLTFPFIWLATFNTGKFLLGEAGVRHMRIGDISRALFEQSFADIVPLLMTMATGGLLLGTIAAVPTYVLTRWLVNTYQDARRRRLQERAAAPAGGQAEVE